MYRIIILISLFSFCLISCNKSSQTGEKSTPSKEFMPESVGKLGEILVLTDSSVWRGEAGRTLENILTSPIAGTLNDEPIFRVNLVLANKSTASIERHHTIIYLIDVNAQTPVSVGLKKMLSDNLKQRISNDVSYHLEVKKDVHANHQLVLYLFGQNAEMIHENLKHNSAQILQLLTEFQRDRMKAILAKKTNQAVSKEIKNQLGIQIALPEGYSVVRKKENFMWFGRSDGAENTLYLFIAKKQYEDEKELLPQQVQAWRDSTAKKYLSGSGIEGDKTTYLMTEELVPIAFKQVNLNGLYATEIRGAWKLKNNARGGTYVGYAVSDSKNLYYIEGFVYAPSASKREYLRELEAIISTVTF
jgi:hypothetical protein